MTTEIDIRAEADRVIALLQQRRGREGLELLNQVREGQSPVVQESLDRFVAAGAAEQLQRLRQAGGVDLAQVGIMPSLHRLAEAGATHPRFPSDAERSALTSDAQRYDVYASIVATRGNLAAQEAMAQRGQRVILGLRQENSTLDAATGAFPSVARGDHRATRHVDESRLGTGVYDDRIVVLWKDAEGRRRLEEADKANTEPTAQYDHHAGSNGRRPFSGGGTETRQVDPSPGFEHVARTKKIEGEDVDGDSYRDLGRLAAGTFEMQRTTHPVRGNPRDFAMRPTQEQVQDNGTGLVERDTNGDGWFTQDDVGRVQDLNASFKIHRGSTGNTDSAGCQTIHPDDYQDFIGAVRGNPQQTRWQYVLTATSPGMFRGVNQQQGVEQQGVGQQDQPQAPQPPREPPGPTAPPQRERDHDAPAPHAVRQPGPFSDPFLNQAYAAALGGDDAALGRVAHAFTHSSEGQEMSQLGRDLLAQQHLQEQEMVQSRSRGRSM